MNTPTQQAPLKIDEKAQIIIGGPSMNPVILRFKSVKKAEQEYKRIQTKWMKLYDQGILSKGCSVIAVKSDMFEATIDLRMYASVCFVTIKQRMEFVPYPG